MKKILLYLVICIVLLGCSHFEISNTIKPKVTIIGNEVGIVYKLGNLTIADTIKPSRKKLKWLAANINNAQWTLYVKWNEVNNEYPYFYYYVNGILFEDQHKVIGITGELILANMDSIPGFHLYKINGKKINEKDNEVIEKEIAKVKKEVKENPDKYRVLEQKW